MQFYGVPEEVLFVVGVLREVQSTYGRVSLVECEEVLLPISLVCDEGVLKELLFEVGDDGLRNLYPWSFYCGVRAVDPSRFSDSTELEQV